MICAFEKTGISSFLLERWIQKGFGFFCCCWVLYKCILGSKGTEQKEKKKKNDGENDIY